MRKLLWSLVFLAVLLLVVDRGGDFAAEQVSADRLQSSQELDHRPEVSIDGFPFLDQFASQKYDHVSAHAKDVRVGKTPLRLSSVRVDFRGVTTNRDYSRFRARTATARATIDYADLSRTLGVTVSRDGAGRVKATKSLKVLGATISPTISVRPRMAGQVLSFTGPRIQGLSGAPAEVAQTLDRVFEGRLDLRALPFDIRVTSLRVDGRGLQLGLAGRNLSYVSR